MLVDVHCGTLHAPDGDLVACYCAQSMTEKLAQLVSTSVSAVRGGLWPARRSSGGGGIVVSNRIRWEDHPRRRRVVFR